MFSSFSKPFTQTDRQTDNMSSQAEVPRNMFCAKTAYGVREKRKRQGVGVGEW